MPSRLRCIILFLLFRFSSADAQEYLYDNFSRVNGLAGNTVYDIVQDSTGFIWLGTNRGVSRFDGFSFTNYTVNDGLADNEVVHLAVDRKGRVWMNCFAASLCYFYQGKIYNNYNDSLLKIINGISNISQLLVDSDDNVWIIGNKIGCYRKDNKVMIVERDFRVGNCNSFNKANYNVVFPRVNKDDPGLEFTFCNEWLKADVNGKISKIGNYSFPNISDKIRNSFLNGVSGKNNDQIFLFNRFGFEEYVFNTISGSWEKKKYYYNEVNKLSYDKNADKIWIATRNDGCFSFDTTGVRHIFKPTNSINGVFTDRSGNIWLPTTDKGVFLLRNNSINVSKFPDNSASEVTTAFSYDNKLLLADDAGNIYKYTNGEISKFYAVPSGYNKLRQFNRSESGTYFIYEKGIVIQHGNEFKSYSFPSTAIKSATVASDSLFIAFNNGVLKASLSHIMDFDTLLSGQRTLTVATDEKNGIYISGVRNLFYYINGRYHIIKSYNVEKEGRVQKFIFGKQSVIFSTYSKGLKVLYNDSLYVINHDSGLPSGMITDAEIMNDSILWVVTDLGISSVIFEYGNTLNYRIRNYLFSDELPDNIYIKDLAIKNDTLYFATSTGLISFHYNTFNNTSDFNVVVNEVICEGETFIPGSAVIMVKSGAVSVNFSAIMFNGNKTLDFMYRLNTNDFWSTTQQRSIQFAELEPGDYVFEIKAVAGNGVVSKNVAKVRFKVLPAFYQTWWFKTVLILFMVVLIFVGVRVKLNRVRRKFQEESDRIRKMGEFKLEAVRSHINPHFIFNSLNSVQHYLVGHNPREANEYLADLSQYIRRSLTLSLTHFYFLKEELELLDAYLRLEKMRFEGAFEYQLIVEVDPAATIVPAMTCQHFVENAIKYGRKQGGDVLMVVIRFFIHEQYVVCEIEDNGPGLQPDKANHYSTGIGLNLHHQRMALIREIFDLEIKTEIKQGISHRGIIVRVMIPHITIEKMNQMNQEREK